MMCVYNFLAILAVAIVMANRYRVAKTDRMPYLMDHFPQESH